MIYTDLGFNEYFEKGREEKSTDKITIEQLPKFSASEVTQFIDAIPPDLIQKKLLTSESGRMNIDLDEGTITMSDGSTNRIFLDSSGTLKISRTGYDATTTSDENLIFSSTFGYVIETYYTISDQHRYTNEPSYHYMGPWNWAINDSEPVAIELTDTDFRDSHVYFELVFTGDHPAVCQAHLYNISKGEIVDKSSLTSGTSGHTEIQRSEEIKLSQGKNRYAVRYRRAGGTTADYPGILMARLIIAKTIGAD